MNLVSSPLLRRLPVAAGVLLAGAARGLAGAGGIRPRRAAARGRPRRRARSAPGVRARARRRRRARPRADARPRLGVRPLRRPLRPTTARPPTRCSPGRPTTRRASPAAPTPRPRPRRGRDHFCFHWVESGADAPPGSDGNLNTIPPYLQDVADVFETVYEREHGELGWHRADQRRRARRLHRGRVGGPHRRLPQGPRQARPLRLRGARRGPGRHPAPVRVPGHGRRLRASTATTTRWIRSRSRPRTSTTTCSSTPTTCSRTSGCSSPPRPGWRRRSSRTSTTTTSTSARGRS